MGYGSGRAHRLTLEEWFELEQRVRAGQSHAAAGRAVGCSAKSVQRLLRRSGGIKSRVTPGSGARLSLADREEISRGLRAGDSCRAIALRLGRAPSTISREVRRVADRERYRTWVAERRAWKRRQTLVFRANRREIAVHEVIISSTRGAGVRLELVRYSIMKPTNLIATLGLTLAFGVSPAAAQEKRVGGHVAVLAFDIESFTGGVGVRASRLFALQEKVVEVSASYDYFHKVPNRKPRVDVAGMDASIVLFKHGPVRPFVGLGIGIMHLDATPDEFRDCDRSDCGSGPLYHDDTAIIIRPTLLGLEVPIHQHVQIRTQLQMLIRRQTPYNGSNKQPFLGFGLDYRF